MLRHFNNYLQSVQTYQDLSPDMTIRQQVNQRLRSQRNAIDITTWCQEFYRATTASQSLLIFIYTHFPIYCGLDVSRIRPQDRLIEDLQFPLVCWFDWACTFCEDFLQQFGIDLSESFDDSRFETLADLIRALDQTLRPESEYR